MQTIVPCNTCYKINRIDLSKAINSQAICANCKSHLPFHDGVQDVNDKTLKILLTKAQIPIVIDFWASWCGPCKMFAPIFKSVAQKMAEQLIFAKLNTEESQASASYHNIQSIPTIIVFNNGIEIDRQSGLMQEKMFSSYLANFINKNN